MKTIVRERALAAMARMLPTAPKLPHRKVVPVVRAVTHSGLVYTTKGN